MNEIRNDMEEIIATKQAINKNAIETESRVVGWTAIFAPIVFFRFGIYFSIIPIIVIARAFHYVKKREYRYGKSKNSTLVLVGLCISILIIAYQLYTLYSIMNHQYEVTSDPYNKVR